MTKNVAASVRQRLQNIAKETGRPFGEVLQYFAMERFLYRLSQAPFAKAFVLKGALLFRVWDTPDSRATRDIDFLAYMENTPEAVALVVKESCDLPVENDGLVFDSDSIEANSIKQDADYEGVRVKFRATLENAIVTMQVDVGFGDTITPEATEAEYPTLLEFEPPKIRIYPPETVVAEKAEAMVNLGAINSRMKDFYDVWRMSRQFTFNSLVLQAAVKSTFENRKTEVIPFTDLSSELLDDSERFERQWNAFVDKNELDAPSDFFEVLAALEEVLSPIFSSIANSGSENKTWHAPGPWK